MIRVLVALALLAPGAGALDAFPTETHWGAREATFVVRASGDVEVHAPPRVNVTTVERDWHGLAGAVAMRATRADGAAATIEITDATGTGVELEWPSEEAHHHVPLPPWMVVATLSATALLLRAARGAWRSR